MDERMLRYTAARRGLGMNYVDKEERLSQILSQMWEIFGEDLILKGGSAINRVYIAKVGAARFSEDIDVDYFGGGVERSARRIKEGMGRIREFSVKGPRVLHRTFLFDCYYRNMLGVRDRVKVEFYLSEPPYVEARVELVKSPFVDAYPTMFKVYSLEDLIARKMVALLRRSEGKDIYDLFHALNMEFNRERLLKAVEMTAGFYHVEGDLFVGLISKLREVKGSARGIGNSTNHFIPRSLRPNWQEIIDTLIIIIENQFL